MTVPQILAILLALPPYSEFREAPEARGVRMHRVAVAIEEASRDLCEGEKPTWPGTSSELEWLLITKGWWESRYAQHIHENRCRPKECDFGRARSPWQLHRGYQVGPETWAKIGTSSYEGTRLAAREAGRVLARGYRRCRTLRGAVSMYATGRTCNWSGSTRRLEWMRRQRRKWGM